MFKKIFFFFFISLLIFNFVSAEKIITVETNENGLQVFYPQFDYVPHNTDFELSVLVSNFSTGLMLPNSNVDCYLHLYNSTGQHTMESGVLTKDANGWDHYIFIDSNNFTDLGDHAFAIFCNSSRVGGEVRGIFTVTEGGIEITEGRSILAIGLLFILVSLMFISLYGVFKIETPSGKFALYWVTHVLAVLICFAGWQFGVEGLLDGTGIVSIFRILFYISTVAIFPMLILSIAWIFYIHTMNDDIRKMVEKGMPVEEAFKRSAKRRYF